MKPGPPPRNPAMRALAGLPGHRKPLVVRRGGGGLPRPPEALQGAALAEWKRVVAILKEEGSLGLLDRAVLSAYCWTWSRLVEAEAALRDGGPMTVAGSHGGQIPRPEVKIAQDASALLVRLANELGLSPTARLRLGTVPPPLSAERERLARRYFGVKNLEE